VSDTTPRQTPHVNRPCGECPWRRDVPPGKFPEERYEALRATATQPENVQSMEDVTGQAMFACHMSKEGHEAACAGFLAVAGWDNLAVRVAVLTGRLPAEALQPKENWPPLFDSYNEMAATQAGPPSEDAPACGLDAGAP
jgi:hypothetical protein